MTSTTPPPIQALTSKEKKYDRQLRLWAANGQQALEEAHVLLVTANAVGVETLKNLVLPGTGHFTVVDPTIVAEEDLGVNFFLEEASLGKSRASECCRLLQELNPDVEGHFIDKSIESLMERDIHFLKPYTLILLCGVLNVIAIEKICKTTTAPIIHIQSVGFYSSFSIQLPPVFPIVDTHPDPASTQDLRLLNPWPELSAAIPKNLEELSDHDHGHVPYVLLFLYYLEKWKDSHDGKPPENYTEKSAFRELLRDGIRTNNPEGGEENYDEAIAAVLKSLNPPSLASGIREMFEMPHCKNITSETANFWIIASAIKVFHAKHGVLPFPGSLPDMKAQSADYIKLQNIYKSKARADVAEVLKTSQAVRPSVPEAEVEQFCKNAAHVKVLTGGPLPFLNLFHPPTNNVPASSAKAVSRSLQDEESLISIYLAIAPSSAQEAPPEALLKDDVYAKVALATEELDRAGGGELHNISSLTGGMVAQEAIKIITRQYVPVDNTCVFDGITSKTESFKL